MTTGLTRKPSFSFDLDTLPENPDLVPYKKGICREPLDNFAGTFHTSLTQRKISQITLKTILSAVQVEQSKQAANILEKAIRAEEINPYHLAIASAALRRARA